MSGWRPSITLENLQARARALSQVRRFFAQCNVMEVETPLVCSHTVTEPNIQSLTVGHLSHKRFLQTSPEYAMKRLLAAGAPDIFQISKCFRQGEVGPYHNPEFTMIEWYRLGYTLSQIMQETVAFISEMISDSCNTDEVFYCTYDGLFQQATGISFSDLTSEEIERLSLQHGLRAGPSMCVTEMVDFLFAHFVNEHLSSNRLTCIYHYPADQAALAKLNSDNKMVAERFEVFYGNLELANGYVELIDYEVQLGRFHKDQLERRRRGLESITIDHYLLDAQKHGLPECAGVAVGFDRLLMLALNAKSINEVISFDWENA